MTNATRVRGQRALRFARHFEELRALMQTVGEPCWAFGPTASAVHWFDGFELEPPFHVVVPRGRHVNRIGQVIHTTTALDLIDQCTVDGVRVTSPTRTII